jgi:cytidylate kinase
MAHGVICISSEDGAGGLGAASLVAKELGYKLIDEEIVTRAALEAGVDEGAVADVERRKPALMRLLEGLATSGSGMGYMTVPVETPGYGQPASDSLRGMIRSVIEETAAAGDAVIVSHAASLALGAREAVLRVLITASPETRAGRVASSLDVDAKEAADMVKRGDAGRADYIKRFYGVGAELPTHYDLVVNTDRLTPEHAAGLILHAARA